MGTSQARLKLLCDVLVLWGHTSNYSSVKRFVPVFSEPIGVVSREIGNNIPRISVNKLSKCDSAIALTEENADPDRQKNDGNEALSNTDVIGSILVRDSDASKAAVLHNNDQYLNPNELVYSGCKNYGEKFTFWQLMGWYNAGTGTKESPPDLFGCLQLPLPVHCFGTCSKAYGANEKKALLQHLRDEKAHMHPWPDSLKCCFANFRSATDNVPGDDSKSKKSKKSSKSKDSKESMNVGENVEKSEKSSVGIVNMALNSGLDLIGSPYLDVMLGQVDAVLRVMQDLSIEANENSIHEDGGQFDNILPPELPTSWIQCDNSDCRKWRRVAWNVDCETLPDDWKCEMNYWDPENATCDAPEDNYDPDRESTLAFKINESEVFNLEVNAWRDVFCLRNKIFYEGQVKAIREENDGNGNMIKKAKFHFKGWGACFDEWIVMTSDRIAPHNLHTNPTKSKNPRIQEKLQVLRGFDHKGKSTTKDIDGKSKISKKADRSTNKPSPTSVVEKSSAEKKRKSLNKQDKEPKKRQVKSGKQEIGIGSADSSSLQDISSSCVEEVIVGSPQLDSIQVSITRNGSPPSDDVSPIMMDVQTE